MKRPDLVKEVLRAIGKPRKPGDTATPHYLTKGEMIELVLHLKKLKNDVDDCNRR